MFNYIPQQNKPAIPTRRQTIMPSYGQQPMPQLNRQQFARPPAPAMPQLLYPSYPHQGPPSGGMVPRIPIGMADSNVLAMGVPGSVTDPQITAELQRRDAMDGREKTQRVIGLIDQNSANQRDVQDMRRVIGGVPGAQTPQGYAAPLSNNGSQVADYTGSMGAFRTDEQRRADRDMANQAMRWQANREADMMSGDLRQRMQRAYGGGDIPVGPPQVRTDGTVMVGNRFMEVPSNMIPVNNSMAGYQQQEGGYSDRVQQRAQQRLAAQGFTSEEDQNAEMARRRASYMADVNSNSERSRQQRRAERMGLIPRGTTTPVQGRAELVSVVPSVRSDQVAKISDSAEADVAPGQVLPGLQPRASDIVRIFDEQEDVSPESVREVLKNNEISLPEAVDRAVEIAVRSREGVDYQKRPFPQNETANAQVIAASQKTADAILSTLSKDERNKAEARIKREIEKLKKARDKENSQAETIYDNPSLGGPITMGREGGHRKQKRPQYIPAISTPTVSWGPGYNIGGGGRIGDVVF